VIDGIVNGFGKMAQWGGAVMRKVQTGQLQHYALIFFMGIVLMLLLLSFTGVHSPAIGLMGGAK